MDSEFDRSLSPKYLTSSSKCLIHFLYCSYTLSLKQTQPSSLLFTKGPWTPLLPPPLGSVFSLASAAISVFFPIPATYVATSCYPLYIVHSRQAMHQTQDVLLVDYHSCSCILSTTFFLSEHLTQGMTVPLQNESLPLHDEEQSY